VKFFLTVIIIISWSLVSFTSSYFCNSVNFYPMFLLKPWKYQQPSSKLIALLPYFF
jgi:hypothetical protein